MADLLDRQLVDAVLGLLRADASLTVYPDAEGFTPPAVTPPYVRAYGWIERPADAPGNSLDGRAQSWTTYVDLHCAGENEYAVIALQMRVRVALLDQRPTVTGRDCGLIREVQCQPPRRDETSGRAVFDGLVQYRFTSN